MKTSKLINGLLLIVSCFIFNVQASQCYTDEIKFKAVFINGMFNLESQAAKSGALMAGRLKTLYGSSVVESKNDYYLARNKWEFGQIAEVLLQYHYELMKNPSYQPENDKKQDILDTIRDLILNSDPDLKKMKVDLNKMYSDGYKFIITGHSQGTFYLNILYDRLLKNWDISRFNTLSLGAPVTIRDPHGIMIMEKSDWISDLNALVPYDIFNRKYNVENSKNSLSGHSLVSYFNGDNTSSLLNDTYMDIFKSLYKIQNNLKITATSSSSNVEFMVTEHYSENMREIHADSSYPNSQFETLSLPIRGELSRDGNVATYAIDCNSFGENVTQLNMCVWNKSGSDIDVLLNYSGFYNNSISDTVEYEGASLESYKCIGNPLNIRNDGDNIFTLY